MGTFSDQFVVLRPGLIVDREAVALVLDLEARGVRLAAVPGGGMTSYPGGMLTEADRAAIRRLRFHVEAVLAYEPPATPVN